MIKRKLLTWGYYTLMTSMASVVFVVIAVATITNLSAVNAKSTSEDQWITVGDTTNGRSILQIDKSSIKITNTGAIATSLIGARLRFIPGKSPLPQDKELHNTELVVITTVESCIIGKGKLLVGPEKMPSEAKHEEWTASTQRMIDIMGVSLCAYAEKEVSRKNRSKDA